MAPPPVPLEEGIDEIMSIAAQRDPRKDPMLGADSVYSGATREQKVVEQTQLGRMKEPMEEGERKTKPKEPRDRRSIELEAKSLG